MKGMKSMKGVGWERLGLTMKGMKSMKVGWVGEIGINHEGHEGLSGEGSRTRTNYVLCDL